MIDVSLMTWPFHIREGLIVWPVEGNNPKEQEGWLRMVDQEKPEAPKLVIQQAGIVHAKHITDYDWPFPWIRPLMWVAWLVWRYHRWENARMDKVLAKHNVKWNKKGR